MLNVPWKIPAMRIDLTTETTSLLERVSGLCTSVRKRSRNLQFWMAKIGPAFPESPITELPFVIRQQSQKQNTHTQAGSYLQLALSVHLPKLGHPWYRSHEPKGPLLNPSLMTEQRLFKIIHNSTYCSPAEFRSARGKEYRCGSWFAWAESKYPWDSKKSAVDSSAMFHQVEHSPCHFLPCSYLPHFTCSRSNQWWRVHV